VASKKYLTKYITSAKHAGLNREQVSITAKIFYWSTSINYEISYLTALNKLNHLLIVSFEHDIRRRSC